MSTVIRFRRLVDHQHLARTLGCAALALGAAAALVYARAGMTLSHYDAKAHLVVARRVIDSLTPGWQQIGAVWLPLPHLINLLPAQVDSLYRTGAFAVAVSVVSFAIAVYAVAHLTLLVTSSRLATLAAALVLALNPNLLYLQSTPMTEPLLLALGGAAMVALWRWIDAGAARPPHAGGWLLAAACLTRYEAWPVALLAVVTAGLALWRRGLAPLDATRRAGMVAAYPACAIALFVLLTRTTMGAWFVTGGFYRADNIAQGSSLLAGVAVWWGTHQLTGYAALLIAVAGAAVTVVAGCVSRRHAVGPLALSAVGAAVLPWYAFYLGHPFRIRYMIPLIPAVAVGVGVAVGWTRRATLAGATALMAIALLGSRPFDRSAPMLLETQWDRENHVGRQVVVEHLRRTYDREKILASMGSLAHVMQELSGAGLHLRDFVHEGNGELWRKALTLPQSTVGWVLIEEQAEGGDLLATRLRLDPTFMDGFVRVSEGGGVALYRSRGRLPWQP